MFANTSPSASDILLILIVSIPATYRVARLVAIDDGPFGIFDRLRSSLGRRAANAPKHGVWWTLAEWANCPYCVGLWVALIPGFLTYGLNWRSIAVWLAIAGGQAWMENIIQRE